MKSTFILIIFSILVIINPIKTSAAEDRQPKTVSGKVRNVDLTVAKNVTVSITCKNTTYSDETSINGNYSVTFANLECEQFDTALVQVNTGSLSGTASKAVTFALNVAMPDIILSNAEIPATVPEWGMIGGIVAAGSSVLTYVTIRRKI